MIGCISGRFALASTILISAAGCGPIDGLCYARTQAEVDEKLLDPSCLELYVVDFPGETLEATSERSDIGLAVHGGDGDSPNLKHVILDHVRSISVTNVESIVATRYQGGMLLAPQLDISFDESPIDIVGIGGTDTESGRPIVFRVEDVEDGGSLRLHATGSMDGWVRMEPTVITSWSNVTIEIDAAAQPTTDIFFGRYDDIRLDQMQAFGAKAQRVLLPSPMPGDLIDAYATWLESEGFAGILEKFVDGEVTTILPRPVTP